VAALYLVDEPAMKDRVNIPLFGALLLVLSVALLAGALPIGQALSRGLQPSLERKALEDLGATPILLADRNAATADALMMHAKDLAQTPGLGAAVVRGDMPDAQRRLEGASGALEGSPVLLRTNGASVVGPPVDPELVQMTSDGSMPVEIRANEGALRTVALAPVMEDGEWVGAAGVVVPIDEAVAERLAGITRSDVVLIGPDGVVSGTTAAADITDAVVRSIPGAEVRSVPGAVERSVASNIDAEGAAREIRIGEARYITATAPLGETGTAVFVRDLGEELAVLPGIRRAIGVSAAIALLIALLLGAVTVALVTRPVRAMATVADRFAAGDLSAPVPSSRIREVTQLGQAFGAMRDRLASRLAELEDANRELAERQARLAALQAELVQRDRLATSGRLVAELAHEIRNPVANVRNSLELIRRRLTDDPEGREFADMAIDELLRMHELAERMLDLHRPRDASAESCDVARELHAVAALVELGSPELAIDLQAGDEGADLEAAISPEALKQVLLNLLQNAREAMGESDRGAVLIRAVAQNGRVRIELSDNGPGVSEDILPRIFDPFFTTKGDIHGVGLGLFVAEGIVRAHGGRLSAANRPDGRGALFTVDLPRFSDAVSEAEVSGG